MECKLNMISYGGTAAIITSMALIGGLEAAEASKSIIVSALLIAALADNLTDSLSIHVYQESERLGNHEAFITTLTNFVTRFLACVSFALIVVFVSPGNMVAVGLAWGIVLLALLTYALAKERNVRVLPELVKHELGALGIIFLSRGFVNLITRYLG